ncbi:hypothetical protein K7432_015262 [Basidiobolus ranarum]|uniref:Uncharacterized protein n=1 Tax=Basidiobolus ranarum TaxID=34480 RepID=A0ABR2VNH8_9FUNG
MLFSTVHFLAFCLLSSVSSLPLSLPTINIDIPCTFRGVNIPLQLDSGTVLLNVEGDLTLREVIDDVGKLGLKLTKFNELATDPVLGNVKFEQVLTEETSTGSIPVLEHLLQPPYFTVFANFKVTSDHSLTSQSSLTLYTLQEAKFIVPEANIFPPLSQYFELESPVALGLSGADPTTSTQGFPSFSIVVHALSSN